MSPVSALVDPDDLAALAIGFEAAMLDTASSDAVTTALFDLGWDELVVAAPAQGAAMAFTALGTTGSDAALLDDVLARALGLDVSLATGVVVPAPHRSAAPGRRHGSRIVVDGIVSRRIDEATTAIVPIDTGAGIELATVDASLVRAPDFTGLDPAPTYGRLRIDLDADAVTTLDGTWAWDHAVAAARAALAHQLVGSSRTMLEMARQHAVDREQFGRPVASFQAVRHKLAEALVQIEGAAAVADVATDDADPLVATLAKSLAGHAARTTATHAQQVLAGIGFTTDHRFHRWLKRTLVLDTLFGSASSLPADIGADLLARDGAPRLVEL